MPRYILVVVFFAVFGCTYQGNDNPVSKRAAWHSYLNGDDLRAACTADAPERYRFIYNLNYQKQIRVYELTAHKKNILNVTVASKKNLLNTVMDSAQPDSLFPQHPANQPNFFLPRHPVKVQTQLNETDVTRLRAALQHDGLLDGAPEGLELPSDAPYWIIVSCRNGRIDFDAILNSKEDNARLSFDDLLLDWDPTGIPIIEVRPAEIAEQFYDPLLAKHRFNLRVGKNGLWRQFKLRPMF